MGHLQLDRAPTVAVMPVGLLAEDVYGTAPELALDDGADEDVVPELQNALALGGTLTGAIVGTLANPNPSTMGTLKNTLQRGRLDISEFVDSEGPAALLDIVDEVASKPKMSWLDEEVRDGAQFRRNGAQFGAILRNSSDARRALSQVLDGALDSLRLMLSAEEGARSLLEAEGAIDRLVALIGRPGGGQKQTASALQIMARLVLISDKPLVESALARANRFRGARVGTTLVDLLKDERGELQTCVDAMTLINALVATTPDKRALVSELVSGGLDIALARLEERVGATPQLVAMGGGGTGQLSKQVSAFMQLKREMEASGRDSASAPAPAPSPTKKPSMLERAGSFFSGKEAAPAAADAPTPPPLAPPPMTPPSLAPPAIGSTPGGGPAPPPPAPPPRRRRRRRRRRRARRLAPKGPQLRMVHWTKWRRRSSGSRCGKMPTSSRAPAVCTTTSRRSSATLFEVKAAPKLSGGAASAAPRKSSVSGAAGAAAAGGGKVQLLDLKRSNQVNIALARFRSVAGPSEVAAAVARMDEKVITADDISRLQACAPTAEEIELLRRYIDGTDAAEGLESAERFLVEMGRVPSLPKLLSSWATKLSFEGRRADASEQLGGLERAAACVRASPTLRTLLGIILSFGNVLNAASARGGARGFRSDVLLKLGETKTTAGASDKCASGRVSNRDTAHEPTAHPAPPATGTRSRRPCCTSSRGTRRRASPTSTSRSRRSSSRSSSRAR